MGNIIQIGQQNTYIERVEKGGQVIINHFPIPAVLNTLPAISLDEVFGREDDLKNVTALLVENSKIVLINGIGGIGKTTLAKAFTQHARDNFRHVAWIEVSGQTAEGFVYNSQLVDSLHLRETLGELPKDEVITKGFELIVNRMRMLDGDNLLVIDNISTDNEERRLYDLLSIGLNWKVISTSRNHLEGFVPYELDIMEEGAALTFFKHHYRRECDDDLIRQILKDIDYHTLLIEVLAKTGQKNKLSLAEIALRIKKKGLNIVAQTSISIPHSARRVYKIMAYLREIFQLSDLSPYETELLTSLSVLPPVHIHYQSLIKLLQIPVAGCERFIAALNVLFERGWIMEKNDSYKVHQVIQEVLRKILKPDIGKCQHLFESYLRNFDPQLHSNSLTNAYLLTYAEYFIDGMGNEKDASLAKLCAWIGEVNEILGKYPELLKYDLRLVKIRRQLFDFYSMEVADAYNNLGLTFVHFKKFRQALFYQHLALKIRQKIIPGGHSFFGRSYTNLNFVYEQKKDYRTALKYGLMAKSNFLKAIAHPVPGDVNEITIRKNLARVYNNLGFVYQKLGDNRRALIYQYKSIKIREALLDPLDPFLSESYFNASYSYYVAGKYKSALFYADKALAIREQILHGGHEQLVKTLELRSAIQSAIAGFDHEFNR